MPYRIETRIAVLVTLATLIVLMPRRSPVSRAPSAMEIEQQICVAILVPYVAPSSAAHPVVGSIERMLRKSTSPSRVSICVYDLGDSVKTHIPLRLQTSVKVARNMLITDPSHASDSDARAWIVQHMFRGERYFMSAPACADVANDWDSKLVDMLPSPMAVLTAQCDAFSTQVPFLALGSIHGSRIVLANVPCIVRPTRPVPSLFWVPNMSFSHSEAIVASPPIGGGLVRNTYTDATLNGICLWTHGYDFFTPHETVMWKSGQCTDMAWRTAPRNRPSSATRALIGTVRTTRAYEAFAGIDLELKVATRRAHTGLTPTYDVTEALVKSGSVQSARIAVADSRTPR